MTESVVNSPLRDREADRTADRADSVAVIVVHGVADQKPGETGLAVAQQVAAIVGGVIRPTDVSVSVEPVQPVLTHAAGQGVGLAARFKKSLGQSMRSDFLDTARAGADEASDQGSAPTLDNGARFSDYLFWKARYGASDPGTPNVPYAHTAACYEVRGNGRSVDVLEMYWADLSRLSGAAGRILSELFTLLFNLSRLGANTVALAAVVNPGNRGLFWLSRAQRAADWLYSRGFAMIVLQLTLCGVLLAAAALDEASLRKLALALALLLPVALLVCIVLGAQWRRHAFALGLLGVVEALLVASLLLTAGAGAAFLAIWLLLVCALQERLLDYWERRFRGVYGAGLFAAAITLAAGAWGLMLHADLPSAKAWFAAALRAVDMLLLALVPFGLVMGAALAAVVICGTWAIVTTRDARLREMMGRTVRTGWFGLLFSLGIFIAFGMTLWAVLDGPLQGMAFAFEYRTWRFHEDVLEAGDYFLHNRFQSTTLTFAFVAICVGLLVLLLAMVLLPSGLVELRWLRARLPDRLAVWLTRGYRWFDWTIFWWTFVLVAVLWLGPLVMGRLMMLRASQELASPLLACLYLEMQEWSEIGLSWVVFPLVGTTTGLIAIGGMALKRLQALRVPLDIALDVDNHFREFPRRAIPRVRIFERYVAEIEMVLSRGYGRVVIVAHSQGTVITADLLRYLQQRLAIDSDPATDRLAQLGSALRTADVSLLTVGSPLRQLYARRFPDLYAWVVADRSDDTTGPDPADLGIRHWLNRWGAADYVGRWLWERNGTPTKSDECTGVDAHTHYFESNQSKVIAALRSLLEGTAQTAELALRASETPHSPSYATPGHGNREEWKRPPG